MPSAKNITAASDLIFRSRPLVIGHRGFCAIAPENTLPSFALAMKAGADLIELDYRHSKDGVPMVIHDATLDRTTNARKLWKRKHIKVANKTATEIQMLDSGNWFDAKFAGAKIPRLTEALDFICGNGAVALIERKSGDAKTLAKLLREQNWICPTVVISFDWKFLRELHELEPDLILGALGPPARLSNGKKPTHLRRGLSARLNDIAKTGASVVVWNRHISKRAIRLAHQRKLKIWIYTINHPLLARRLLNCGVDGIITNDAGLFADKERISRL
jgi:glycerophosphoryl diester phosphodiesterase